MELYIPRPIIEAHRRLNEMVEENPIDLPVPEVADFCGMAPDSLRCALEQNRAPFGFGWQKSVQGNRGFKIPSVNFYHWVTQGHMLPYINAYLEGKN